MLLLIFVALNSFAQTSDQVDFEFVHDYYDRGDQTCFWQGSRSSPSTFNTAINLDTVRSCELHRREIPDAELWEAELLRLQAEARKVARGRLQKLASENACVAQLLKDAEELAPKALASEPIQKFANGQTPRLKIRFHEGKDLKSYHYFIEIVNYGEGGWTTRARSPRVATGTTEELMSQRACHIQREFVESLPQASACNSQADQIRGDLVLMANLLKKSGHPDGETLALIQNIRRVVDDTRSLQDPREYQFTLPLAACLEVRSHLKREAQMVLESAKVKSLLPSQRDYQDIERGSIQERLIHLRNAVEGIAN